MSKTPASEHWTIWKLELRPTTMQSIAMPSGARLLHVGAQVVEQRGSNVWGRRTAPMLWALVNPDAPTATRTIALVGTGHPAPPPDDAVYVGSCQCDEFVWHIFDGGQS
jgi:hypothetical protein